MKDLQLKLFRHWVTVAVFLFLVCHISLVLLFTFVPNFSVGRSSVASFYEHFVHLGPFFREASIQSSPHVVVSANGGSMDLIEEYQHRYNVSPIRPHNLVLRDHARKTADELLRNSHRAKRKLAELIQEVDPTIPLNDSVRLTYYHSWYNAESDTFQNDTLISIKTILVKP